MYSSMSVEYNTNTTNITMHYTVFMQMSQSFGGVQNLKKTPVTVSIRPS